MAFDPEIIDTIITDLDNRPQDRRAAFLEGVLMRTEYAGLFDALQMMRAAAENEAASAAVRQGNDTAARMLLAYMNTIADSDGVPAEDRFWLA